MNIYYCLILLNRLTNYYSRWIYVFWLLSSHFMIVDDPKNAHDAFEANFFESWKKSLFPYTWIANKPYLCDVVVG